MYWKLEELDWTAKLMPCSRDFVVLVKPGRRMVEPTGKRSSIYCCVIPTPLYVVMPLDFEFFEVLLLPQWIM